MAVGHANHSMFWEIMGGRGGDPSGELAEAITRDFGSLAAFRRAVRARVQHPLRLRVGPSVTVSREGRLAIAQGAQLGTIR